MAMARSTSGLRKQRVPPVRYARAASNRRPRHAGCRCGTGTRTKRSKRHGTANRRSASKRSTPAGLAWKAPFPKAHGWGTCDGRATLGWAKPASCICSWQRRSTSCGSRRGSRRHHARAHGSQPLPHLQEHRVNEGPLRWGSPAVSCQDHKTVKLRWMLSAQRVPCRRSVPMGSGTYPEPTPHDKLAVTGCPRVGSRSTSGRAAGCLRSCSR